VLVPFLYQLRSRRVPVGTQEALALCRALLSGLHDSSLDGFYWVARALLVHSETHLDAFDEAFAKHFKGIESQALEIHQQMLEWLKEAQGRVPTLTEEERKLLEQLDRDTLEKLLEERLKEQRERHDGGNRWVGTRGRSPLGHSGTPVPNGIRVGGTGRNRSAYRVATARHFRGYRDDVILDVRQTGLALRKLRAFAREGEASELDIDGSIEQTAKNLGELELVQRPPRKSTTRVILLMDVGGSMDPYADEVSRLFTAAKKATHFRELKTYYFHNCVYNQVYPSARLDQAIPLSQLFAETHRQYKLIMVGDALMAPWELMARASWHRDDSEEGIVGLMKLAQAYPHSAWLNPEPRSQWFQSTIEVIRRVFPMFPLTLEGLSDAVTHLTAKGRV
jgi:uncharacterized protein with von Willebrand factor type A (vWA) domain